MEGAPGSLAGRLVAVAGAGGSLGPALVPVLADRGARLALAGRTPEKLAALAAGSDVQAVDLLDEASARAWAERLGPVDGLVNLVGGWVGGTPIEQAPASEWQTMHDQLVLTTQHLTRAFAPALMASGRGRFVIVSSPQAQSPTQRGAAYAAAKAAAETWTLALADRFRGTGATANVVQVGAILTPRMREEAPERDFSSFTPAQEIAEAIAFLLSEAAASMNGQRLVLRGAR